MKFCDLHKTAKPQKYIRRHLNQSKIGCQGLYDESLLEQEARERIRQNQAKYKAKNQEGIRKRHADYNAENAEEIKRKPLVLVLKMYWENFLLL